MIERRISGYLYNERFSEINEQKCREYGILSKYGLVSYCS